MSFHDERCLKCKKLNWIWLSDSLGAVDYDGFKCFSCGHEQSWPGWEIDMGEPEYFEDGMSSDEFIKHIQVREK